AMGNHLAEQLESAAQQLQMIAQQNADAAEAPPLDQRVLVQHKVPRVIADLVKGQFHLMQEWMRPLLAESIDNGRDLSRLHDQLEAMMQTYTEVEGALQGQRSSRQQT
ncbi:MAG: hypothetical protein AAF670_20240, partial [Planctomycetota bacterium]